MKDEKGFYKQGYKTGYMTAVSFLCTYTKDMSNLEIDKIIDDLLEYYNSYPLIEKLSLEDIKKYLQEEIRK